jgi:lysophospholipase L1-like esterase
VKFLSLAIWFTAVSLLGASAGTSTSKASPSKKKPVKKAQGVRTHTAAAKGKTGSLRRKAPAQRARTWVRPVSPEVRREALSRISERMTPAVGHFENASALTPFFNRLAASRSGGEPVHILQFGDSHTASDDWVDSMRQEFQGMYGIGGPGFSMAGRPFRGYRRFDIRGGSSAGWQTEGTVSHPGDGLAGLSGISITAQSAGETVWADAGTQKLDLYYLQQPGGGSFDVEVDGARVTTVTTDGTLSTGVYTVPSAPGEHIFGIRTVDSGPVRLYGWAPTNASGVTWETLGINGAQAGMILNWDEGLWAQQLQLRNPALVVLAYGTNEANSPGFDAEVFRAGLRNLFARFRRAVPDAALLLVGPPDCGRLHALAHLDEVVEIERATARASGVAFWDWRERMGGPRATVTWVHAGLGQPDYVHLTGSGYRMAGQALAGDLDLEFRQAVAQSASPASADDPGRLTE